MPLNFGVSLFPAYFQLLLKHNTLHTSDIITIDPIRNNKNTQEFNMNNLREAVLQNRKYVIE